MPPKKKGNDKNSAVPSSAITENEPEIVLEKVDFVADEEHAINFTTDPTTDVLAVWHEIFEKANERILEKHIG